MQHLLWWLLHLFFMPGVPPCKVCEKCVGTGNLSMSARFVCQGRCLPCTTYRKALQVRRIQIGSHGHQLHSSKHPPHHHECKFRKTTGGEHKYDATAISDIPEIANITFRVPGPYSVRIVGLTTDPGDDDNFEHGGFIKFDERGRVLTPSHGSIQHMHNVYTLKVSDPIAQRLEAFINATSLGTFQAPSPIHGKTMYAKMFIQTVGAEIIIMQMDRIRDCVVCDWGEWSSCPVSCDGGIEQRTRCIKVHPIGQGRQCSNLKETKTCHTKPCPAPCEWTDWGCWSPCSVTCEGGKKARARVLVKEAQTGGSCHGTPCETASCNTQECPAIPCEWCEWSSFSKCSAACGWGEQQRTRHICRPAEYGGKPCEGAIVQKQACEESLVRISCALGIRGRNGLPAVKTPLPRDPTAPLTTAATEHARGFSLTPHT